MNAPATAARTLQSDYMHFAKFGADARYNLASSGVANCELADLRLTMDDLALHGTNTSGYRPLMQRVAERFGVDLGCVVMPGGGCSFANHLAFSVMLSPGDEVLVEDPTYELLTSTLGFLGARMRTFERSPAEAWRLDPDRIAAAITPATRLVVLTNLHNPSSALAPIADVHAVASMAERVGAMVFVDEVYLELLATDDHAPTAFRDGGNIVVTSSLTKAYGVSGLRCGWILAPPALAERMKRLNDLFGVHPPHVAERMSMVAFDRLPELRARAAAILEANRAAYRAMLGGHPKLDQMIFDQGTTVFPRLLEGDGDRLFERLTAQFETSLAPGRFFARPDRVRIGLGGDPQTTAIGLQRVAEALG
jgi:aspartate/methionine/tyrosine aminotransferase